MGLFIGVPEAIETRFHNDEIKLLDQLAKDEGLSREETLEWVTLHQATKSLSEPVSGNGFGLVALVRDFFSSFFSRSVDLSNTTILKTQFTSEDVDKLKYYRRIHPDIRTSFGLPRHALIAELLERGKLSGVEPPACFSALNYGN